jgi:hypothetical protein
MEEKIRKKLLHLFDLKRNISKNAQINIWKKLSKEWQDDRTYDEIINDIYDSRTLGREFQF